MLGEIISFGGRWKNPAAIVRERRKNNVRLITENDNKVVVRVVTASRDKDGKMGYTTFDSLEVADAKPEQVFAVCKEAILRAPAK